jgi:D-erythronate 2-dehydrogenase
VKILITGADGFIGRSLVQRLRSSTPLPGIDIERDLVLLDRDFAARIDDPRVRCVTGDLTRAEVMREALGEGADLVFHLASVPGGASESDFALGLRVNLEGTLTLLERLRAQSRPNRITQVVFASTIGVYGVPLPPLIDESTPASPTLSYGAQKLASEILVTEYSRRGFIDGRSLRLPGIVARPPSPAGLLSAFLSDLIRTLSAGGRFTCPVSANGRVWWMSRPCVVDNLLHAAGVDVTRAQGRRVWLLPVQHASIADVVRAIATLHGAEVESRVTYRRDPALEAQFASYPRLHCPAAIAAGFRPDESLQRLVQLALDGP